MDLRKTVAKIKDKAGAVWGHGQKKVAKLAKRNNSKRRVRRPRTPKPPQGRFKRVLWYMHPRRFRDFWFTKPGLRLGGKVLAIGGLVVLGGIIALFAYVARDLPSPGQIETRLLAQTTKFYDRTGEHVLYEVFGDQNRSIVSLEEVSDHLKHATIAIEDRNFYDQGAFSITGIVRATINNVFNAGMAVQGGSTITQQYVKNALLTPERTFNRKLRELILSIWVEQLYGKDDILERYLNTISYGSTAYGVQAAAQMYFSKDAKDLTIEESAMLAAMIQAPTYYSPYGGNIEALHARQQLVIDLMYAQDYISEEEAEEAKAVDFMTKVNDVPAYYDNVKAPHFVLHVQGLLEERYGSEKVNTGGLEVITTLDWEKQQIADEAMANNIVHVDNLGGDNAALVAEDPHTGQVLAMVGSRDFAHPGYGAFNAALSGRQPGSSFKPYAYALLFQDDRWGPGSVMYDVRTDFGGGYTPRNFDGGFRGFMTVRTALAESRNIPAVKALYIAGVGETIRLSHEMGINTLQNPDHYGLSLVLGAGEVRLAEHVNGYSTFANGGLQYDQNYILKVTDSRGTVLEEWQEQRPERVLDPQIAYLTTHMLADDAARAGTFGRNNPNIVVPGVTTAAKTGTTDEARDGWMMGYSRHITAGVWVGNHDNRPMHSITSSQTGPIWTEFMRRVHEDLPDQDFERPAGIKTVTLDAHTGMTPSSVTNRTVTDIFPSWYQPPGVTESETAVIDRVSGNLATDCTPEAAREEITAVSGIRAEIPPNDPAFHRWDPPVQALARNVGGNRGGQSIPTRESTVHSCDDEKPQITEFTAEQVGNAIELTATVSRGTHPLDRVEFRYKGQIVSTASLSGSSPTRTVTYQPTEGAGTYNFTATAWDRVYYASPNASASVTFTPNDDDDDPDDLLGVYWRNYPVAGVVGRRTF